VKDPTGEREKGCIFFAVTQRDIKNKNKSLSLLLLFDLWRRQFLTVAVVG